MKLVIPANIRFTFYNTAKDVKLENKFAAIPLYVPLDTTMASAYNKITKVTKQLRNSIGHIYAVYAISFWSTMVLPRALIYNTISSVSKKWTMAFSNTPGPIKPFFFKNPNTGEVIRNLTSQSYLVVAGKLGMALCAIS